MTISREGGVTSWERESLAKTRAIGSLGKGPPIIENPKSTIQIDCEPNYR